MTQRYTDQELFDKVAGHLLKQGVRAMRLGADARGDSKEMCAYRGYGGLKCAAGCLVDDVNYNPDMEGRRCTASAPRDALLASGVTHDQIVGLVSTLQDLHDTREPRVWAVELAVVAKKFNLQPQGEMT